MRKKAFGKNGVATSGETVSQDRCPLLGLVDDPDTAFAFSTDANHCHNTVPPASVRLNHQQKYCLSADYVSCPLFRQRDKVSLPARRRPLKKRLSVSSSLTGLKALLLESLAAGRLGRYRAHFLFGWAALLVGALILLLGWLNAGAIANTNGRPIAERPLAAVHTPTPEPSPLPATSSRDEAVAQADARMASTVAPSATATPSPPPTETALPTATPTLPPTATAVPSGSLCGPPAGWVLYTVQAGENLYRISLRYDVSLAQMRQANCLASNDIYAGQRIYVPYLTPSPTEAVATPTSPPPSPTPDTPTPVPPTATLEPSPTATPVPPTATPEPSPTSPPPAETPVPPTPTPTPLLEPPSATPRG